MVAVPVSALGRCMRLARFEVRTREEAAALAHVLGELCLHHEEVTLVLSELMLNAIEHGNLGIGGDLKSELLMEGRFDEEIAARSTQAPYCDRHVTVEYLADAVEQRIAITDEGAGFDWHEVMSREQAVSFAPNGRGLMLVRSLDNAKLEFNAAGNSVTVRTRW